MLPLMISLHMPQGLGSQQLIVMQSRYHLVPFMISSVNVHSSWYLGARYILVWYF